MVFAVIYLPGRPVDAGLPRPRRHVPDRPSAFTLAKCVRDAQENQAVYARLDQARVEKILAEHDPFRDVS